MAKSKKKKVIKPKAIKRKAKAKVSTPVNDKLRLLNFKANGKDRKSLHALAKKHAGNNISAWLRHAGLNYKPKKGEVIR